MVLEESLYLFLTNDTTIAGTIGTRLYPLLIPQDADLPAMAYQVVSDVPEYSHDGRGREVARVQLTCQAATYAAAKVLARAVKDAFDRWPAAMVKGLVDGWSDEFQVPVVRVDVSIGR